jgi:hypothetical protein
VLQDRLVGRIGPDDELSADQGEWHPFDGWPELASALAASASPDLAAEPEWLRERARARLRWADERGMPERRTRPEGVETPGERRDGREERRTRQTVDTGARTQVRARVRFGHDRALIKIVVALLVAGGLIALVAWLYGPVNPVPVHIRSIACRVRIPLACWMRS